MQAFACLYLYIKLVPLKAVLCVSHKLAPVFSHYRKLARSFSVITLRFSWYVLHLTVCYILPSFKMTSRWQAWLFSSTSTYHLADLLTTRGVNHLIVHGTSDLTSYKTIPRVRLKTSGDVLSTVDVVMQWCDRPRWLRDRDDDGDLSKAEVGRSDFGSLYNEQLLLYSLLNSYPHKRRHSRWKLSQGLKRQVGYILSKVHVWKWPVVKYKHIKIKPRICVLFILCLTWTVNANSLKQNIIVI